MSRRPYKELPIFFPQPIPEVDTVPVEELGGPSGQLNEIKDLYLGKLILTEGFYDDAQLFPETESCWKDKIFLVHLLFCLT